MKKRILWIIALCATIVVLFVCNIRFSAIYSLPEGFLATHEEVEQSNKNAYFGSFVSASLENLTQSVSTDKHSEGTIVFKLFGFIPIRKINVVCANEEEVYLGGVPIGINISTQGAIVINEKMVETGNGFIDTEKNVQFKEGDLLTKINGVSVSSLDNLTQIIENSEDENFEITYLRKNKEYNAKIKGVKDVNTGKYKLGLWVKDDVSGIGTLTYVNKETHKFGALGHAVTDAENCVNVSNGKVYACKLIGIDKGEKNDPGELRCVFLNTDKVKGDLEKNTRYGVFGDLTDLEDLVDENLSMKIGGRLSVNPGKAYIVSSVSGIREEYEIEIIKASYQSKADDKSIVFRVKDKRLLDLTGGIVQGMSGSPIIQNGKLIGAVTHVFTADPTKGYGIYSDWMVANEN